MPSRKFLVVLVLGLVIFSIQVSMVLGEEAPIYIAKSRSGISPNPASVNQSIQLKVCVHNLNESEISCSLKTSALEHLSIYPSGEVNVTVLGKGHGYDYSAYANTYFYFTVMPDRTGAYPITVELWYEGKQVDFYSVTLQVQEEQPFDVSSYEFRLSFVYGMAMLTVGIVYLKVLYDEGKFGDLKFWKIGLIYLLWLSILVEINYFWGGFSTFLSYLIAPSIGKIELILAVTLILCFASLILMKDRLDASFKLVNVIVFLTTLPIVLDWLFIPNIPSPETLVGKIIWQLIEIVVGTLIGTILSIIFKRKSNKVL